MLNWACVYEFCEARIRGARRFYFVGALLFCDNVQTQLGGGGGGASIREGASNRDIRVCEFKLELQPEQLNWVLTSVTLTFDL